jgi:hypothetical protein
VDLVKDDQSMLVCFEEEMGFSKACTVSLVFQIKVERIAAFGNLKCHGRLT